MYMKTMDKAITSTLAYFSIFDYPLTLIELWQWLYWQDDQKPIFENYLAAVKVLEDGAVLVNKDGFLCLAGREEIVEKRRQNYRDSFAKYEIARRVGRCFAILPSVKAIFVCNSLSYNNSRQSGDIDFFIVVKDERLWLTRFCCLSILKIFNLRPTADNKQNKIDPTFFISHAQLSLNGIALDNDIYLRYWLAQLSPLYDPDNVLAVLRDENQKLLNDLPNSLPTSPHARRVIKNSYWLRGLRFIMSGLINYHWLEVITKRWQLAILPSALKDQLNKNKGVVVNDHMIKMHKADRRQEYLQQWQNIIAQLAQHYDQ